VLCEEALLRCQQRCLPAFAEDARERGTSLASKIGMQQREAKRLERRTTF